MPICLWHTMVSYLVKWSDSQVSLLFLWGSTKDLSSPFTQKTGNFPKQTGASARRRAVVAELGEENAYEPKFYSVWATLKWDPFHLSPLGSGSEFLHCSESLFPLELEINTHIYNELYITSAQKRKPQIRKPEPDFITINKSQNTIGNTIFQSQKIPPNSIKMQKRMGFEAH